MKIGRIESIFYIISLSSAITSLVYEIRFWNPLLKKEMFLILNDGNGYFLTFAYLNLMAIVLCFFLFRIIDWRFGNELI